MRYFAVGDFVSEPNECNRRAAVEFIALAQGEHPLVIHFLVQCGETCYSSTLTRLSF